MLLPYWPYQHLYPTLPYPDPIYMLTPSHPFITLYNPVEILDMNGLPLAEALALLLFLSLFYPILTYSILTLLYANPIPSFSFITL